MNLRSLVSSSAFMLTLTTSASAQTLITGADTQEILGAARAHGTASLATQSNGDPQINGEINGVTYQIYFRNCTDNANCEDLNFYAGFLDLKPGPEVINNWNAAKRFSRAYVDQDQDACIEMDLDLVFGVTAEHLDAQFEIWNLVLTQFTEHVGYR